MSIHELIIMMRLNLKDIVIILQISIITVLYFSGAPLTTRQPRVVKEVAAKLMNGAIFAELATVLLWIFCLMQ